MTRRSPVARLLDREPVAWLAVVEAGLGVAVVFGAHLSPKQIAALIVLARAVFALLARRLVTPVADPNLPHRNPGRRHPPSRRRPGPPGPPRHA